MESEPTSSARGRTGASAAASLEFRAVSKRYGLGSGTPPAGTPAAVDNLSFEVPAGAVCVLVGPSGCGKTTSLKMVNRLIEPTSGQILLDGVDVQTEDVTALRRRIGYVIQQVGLFPHLTVGRNVAVVPALVGWSKQRQRARSDELLSLVGLEPERYRNRYPAQLSGGERQRVGVARALAADPPLMLMDEPFAAVDPIAREGLQDEFLRLQKELAKTILFVTHDVDEAIKMGDLIAVLAEGGHLARSGPPTRSWPVQLPTSSRASSASIEVSSGSPFGRSRICRSSPSGGAMACRPSPRRPGCATHSRFCWSPTPGAALPSTKPVGHADS